MNPNRHAFVLADRRIVLMSIARLLYLCIMKLIYGAGHAIRIFVGCSANGEDAEMQALLEYSLRHYATEPLELIG